MSNCRKQAYTNPCSTKRVICRVYLFRYSKEKLPTIQKKYGRKVTDAFPCLRTSTHNGVIKLPGDSRPPIAAAVCRRQPMTG